MTMEEQSKSLSETSSQQPTVDQLIHAVQYGDLVFVQNSIENLKMSPNTADHDGCSLLHWASINNRLEIVRYLINRCANVNAIGGENREIPLQWAVRQPHSAKVVDLLINANSNLSHKSNYSLDSLFLAVQAGHIHLIYLLLLTGCDPNTTDSFNDTPLLWALKNDVDNCLELTRLLIRFGANPAHLGSSGNALHLLTLQGKGMSLNIALTVYGNGSDAILQGQDKDGMKPTQLAIKTRNSKMLKFLFDAYFYTHFPKWLPIFFIAACYPLFFILPNIFGSLYGLLADLALYFCVSPLLQSNILVGDSRYSCGFAWGIITIVTSCYYIFLSSYFSSLVDYWIAIHVGFIAYTLYKSMYTPPQHLSPDDTDER
jgi:ankyrin repeat protein